MMIRQLLIGVVMLIASSFATELAIDTFVPADGPTGAANITFSWNTTVDINATDPDIIALTFSPDQPYCPLDVSSGVSGDVGNSSLAFNTTAYFGGVCLSVFISSDAFGWVPRSMAHFDRYLFEYVFVNVTNTTRFSFMLINNSNNSNITLFGSDAEPSSTFQPLVANQTITLTPPENSTVTYRVIFRVPVNTSFCGNASENVSSLIQEDGTVPNVTFEFNVEEVKGITADPLLRRLYLAYYRPLDVDSLAAIGEGARPNWTCSQAPFYTTQAYVELVGLGLGHPFFVLIVLTLLLELLGGDRVVLFVFCLFFFSLVFLLCLSCYLPFLNLSKCFLYLSR